MPPASPRIVEDVTVVIPTLGRPLLVGCLRSIVAGTVWPAELLIVDQGVDPAADGWVADAVATGLSVRHIRSTGTGTAAGTNLGLAQVITAKAAVTHDDCLVEPNWLERMSARLDEHPDAIVTGRVAPDGDEPVPSTKTSTVDRIYDRPQLKGDPLFPANMGLRIKVARSVGPFDEDVRVRLAEDSEWCYRALRRGVPVVYAADVRVRHVAWRGEEQRAATYRGYARSLGGFYGKYLRAGDLFIARRIVLDLARGPWMWVRGTLSANPDLRALGRGYIRELAPGVIGGLRRRMPA